VTAPKPDNRTRLVVAVTLAMWLVWDAYVWLAGRETISAVFGWAFSWPWLGWWVAGTFGFLCGHLLGMTDVDAPGYWWRAVAVPLGAAAAGFLLTRWS